MLSIPEVLAVEIFPNPADISLTVQTKEKISQIDLFTMQGLMIQTFTSIDNNNFNINLQHLPSGIYMIRIFADNRVITKKIMVYK
jgi:hypothetical protein